VASWFSWCSWSIIGDVAAGAAACSWRWWPWLFEGAEALVSLLLLLFPPRAT
jgi:hypothetical protein